MKQILLLIGLSFLLSGCVHPYEVPVDQGIQLTSKQMSQLKPGMTKNQVEFILGTPNIKDPFYAKRWYYIYTEEHDYLPRVERHLVVYFKDGKVDKISGDYTPPVKLEYSGQ